jgi:hypothetical protein
VAQSHSAESFRSYPVGSGMLESRKVVAELGSKRLADSSMQAPRQRPSYALQRRQIGSRADPFHSWDHYHIPGRKQNVLVLTTLTPDSFLVVEWYADLSTVHSTKNVDGAGLREWA